jgi:hypothetical protein
MQKQLTPHIHSEVIKAWASGEIVQFKTDIGRPWYDLTQNDTPGFHKEYEYRIKPEPKEDSVYYMYARKGVDECYSYLMITQDHMDNLKLTFDGETGKLKAAEVINN